MPKEKYIPHLFPFPIFIKSLLVYKKLNGNSIKTLIFLSHSLTKQTNFPKMIFMGSELSFGLRQAANWQPPLINFGGYVFFDIHV